ncbi:hypothetical protein MRB53_000573 [Persea americana]|uniref:Uncharacterized protein n=1 Tax=Persea americana TaxID=3435 RepID=A0ACC2MPH8_PERAE|nr:hypothetical protein MRB53_000573 [Persea americana]
MVILKEESVDTGGTVAKAKMAVIVQGVSGCRSTRYLRHIHRAIDASLIVIVISTFMFQPVERRESRLWLLAGRLFHDSSRVSHSYIHLSPIFTLRTPSPSPSPPSLSSSPPAHAVLTIFVFHLLASSPLSSLPEPVSPSSPLPSSRNLSLIAIFSLLHRQTHLAFSTHRQTHPHLHPRPLILSNHPSSPPLHCLIASSCAETPRRHCPPLAPSSSQRQQPSLAIFIALSIFLAVAAAITRHLHRPLRLPRSGSTSLAVSLAIGLLAPIPSASTAIAILCPKLSLDSRENLCWFAVSNGGLISPSSSLRGYHTIGIIPRYAVLLGC